MIKSVTITSKLASRKIDLRDPSTSGFALVNISGLGPVKSNITISDTALANGGVFNTARTSYRSIAITLVYMPGHVKLPEQEREWMSIEDLRNYTYQLCPNQSEVNLLIENDNGIYSIDGYVEDNNVNIFSSREGSVINILCPDPYFRNATDGDEKMTVFTGIEPEFEFAFSNESLTQKLLETGEIKKISLNNVLYKGTINTGTRIVLSFNGDAKNIKLFNLTTSELLSINRPFVSGDNLEITSVVNNKKVILTHGSVKTNIIGSLDLMSDWINLQPGDNVIGYQAEEGDNHIEMRIYYKEYCLSI